MAPPESPHPGDAESREVRATAGIDSDHRLPFSLFKSGINWGRVIALLGFGYRMAIHVYQQGRTGFLRWIARCVVEFMLRNRIAQWIAQQGGWVRMGPAGFGRRTVKGGDRGAAPLGLTCSGYSLFPLRRLHSIWTMFT